MDSPQHRRASTTSPSSSVWHRTRHYATSEGTPGTALRVAIVVGTILNMINQGDALFSGKSVVWWKILLTYAVPYCVSTYGAVRARLRAERRAGSGLIS